MEAISETDRLVLDRSTDAYVRFQPASWDRFDLQGTGTGWPPSKALILLEVNCQENPLGSKLTLCMGPGSDAAIRERLWNSAIRNPHLFKTSGSLGDWNPQLLRDPVALLTEEDLGLAWDDGRATERIRGRFSRFFEERLPAIDEIITACFETEPRSESNHDPIPPPSDSETSA